MKTIITFALISSFVAFTFAATISASQQVQSDVPKKVENFDGDNVIPVVQTVGGIVKTFYFSVVDGATIYIDDLSAGKGQAGSGFLEGGFLQAAEGSADSKAFGYYVQKASEEDAAEDVYVLMHQEQQSSLALSQAVKQVLSASAVPSSAAASAPAHPSKKI